MNAPLRPSAVLAEDEPLLRAELRAALAALWPELAIVGEAADGIAASRLLDELHPDIAFLDVRMPGLSGVEVARLAAQRCHIVFLTAYNDYALAAFDHGAIDYLLKPLDMARLATAVKRLKARLPQTPADLSALVLETAQPGGPLRWIQASAGAQLRFVSVDDVLCFRADAKYTRVVTARFDAHIRTTIKELAERLDSEKFWQISRGAIVSVAAIDAVTRQDGGLVLRLSGNDEILPVTQTFQHRFRQM